MTPQYYILTGDAETRLRELPGESVHCCVTSPAYFGLRDYGTGKWEGGDAACDHLGARKRTQAGFNERYHGIKYDGDKQAETRYPFAGECGKCGARRVDLQMGLERTPTEYVDRLVRTFREVRRVLRGDGTVWLVIGDSYTTGASTSPRSSSPKAAGDVSKGLPRIGTPAGMKPKDLIGIPWSVAFALRADGWYLRADIIWHKPNCFPSSVKDRPTLAHEYLFMLSKSAKYYYDSDAIMEPAVGGGHPVSNSFRRPNSKRGLNPNPNQTMGTHRPDREDIPYNGETRNKRSVWSVPTKSYPQAHFATYPEKLIEPCILAGCPIGGTVLDPFAGSGTTLSVALRLDRNAVGVELNPAYVELAHVRVRDMRTRAGVTRAVGGEL